MQTKAKGLAPGEGQKLRALGEKHLFQSARLVETPGGAPVFVAEEGSRVFDSEGKSYISGFAGLMYKNVGYGRKEIADAVYAQMLKLTSPPVTGATAPAIMLAAKLAEITPGSLSRSFLCTGGAESIEAGIKIAKQYQRHAGFPNRYKIIGRDGEYHGSGSMTMALGRP